MYLFHKDRLLKLKGVVKKDGSEVNFYVFDHMLLITKGKPDDKTEKIVKEVLLFSTLLLYPLFLLLIHAVFYTYLFYF